MNIERFEKICRASRLRPEKRVQTDHGTIYVAEGYFNTGPEYDKPHYKTVWATAKGAMDIGRPLYFDFGKSKKEERIAKAIEDARTYLNG